MGLFSFTIWEYNSSWHKMCDRMSLRQLATLCSWSRSREWLMLALSYFSPQKIFMYFIYVYVYICMNAFHLCVLEEATFISPLTRVTGGFERTCGSSVRTISTYSCWAIFPGSIPLFHWAQDHSLCNVPAPHLV